MNKKGFTLVELLAVVIILALLALLTSTAVTKLVKDSKEDLYNTQIALIKSAAESWGADNLLDLPDSGECSYLTLADLKGYGLIDSDITDPRNNEPFSDDLKIKITTTLSSYGKPVTDFEVNPESIDGCSHFYLQIYKPQYYSWVGGNIGGDLPSDTKENVSQVDTKGYPFYLGLDVDSNNKVSAAYVCFTRNETEYCLKGYDTEAHETNRSILEGLCNDVGSDCSGDSTPFEADGLRANAYSGGSVGVSDVSTSTYCEVFTNGGFGCDQLSTNLES